jgi:hypothetical protein
MMNNTNDNTPIGMSLRDWFAGMALTAHCSAALTTDGAAAFEDVARKKSITVEQVMANASYEMADAMLKAREQA